MTWVTLFVVLLQKYTVTSIVLLLSRLFCFCLYISKMFVGLTENEVEIISDLLANFHDWDVEDLKKAFVDYICLEIPSIDSKTASYIYDKFMKIPAPIRFHRHFNHKDFIYKLLS